MIRKRFIVSVLTGLIVAAPAPSASVPFRSEQSPKAVLQGDGTVVSRHVVRLGNGRHVSYTARAGFLPLRRDGAANGTGETLAQMFFIAYTADASPKQAARPVTFIWGGGPGSSSSLAGIGPRRLRKPEVGSTINPHVVDNQDTWLDMTDLVLIDEIGTGYSRMTSPDHAPLFFSRKADAEAFTEFMRIYMRRYDTKNAPIIVRGGSYGSIRAATVAQAAKRRSIPIRGMIISANAILSDLMSTDIYMPLLVPTFTSTALFHNRLSPELQADRDAALRGAERWATGPYAAALGRGNALSAEERREIARTLSRYTGLSTDTIEENNLRIDAEIFTNELLRKEGRIVGRYDTRIAPPGKPAAFNPQTDPSLLARPNAMPNMMERLYLSRELGVNTDILGPSVDGVHLGPFGGAWPPPPPSVYPVPVSQSAEWMASLWNGQGDPGAIGSGLIMSDFVEGVHENEDMRVLMIGGRFDLATPYYTMDYLQARVRPEARHRIQVSHVDAGHGLRDADIRAEARRFYADILKSEPVPIQSSMDCESCLD